MNTVDNFKILKDKFEKLKIEKVRIATTIENLTKEKTTIEQEILTTTKTNSIEEAKNKLTLAQTKLETVQKELEELLGEDNDNDFDYF